MMQNSADGEANRYHSRTTGVREKDFYLCITYLRA